VNHTNGEKLANVTLSLPDDLLREARHLAVDQGLSLSRFVARSLEAQVLASRGFRVARERQLRLLQTGVDLGTRARIDWPRGSLHER
jgi:hypothetical protein